MPSYRRLGSLPRKRHIAHPHRARLPRRGHLLRGSRHPGRLRPGLQHLLSPAAADPRSQGRSRPGPCRSRPSQQPALRHHHLKTGAAASRPATPSPGACRSWSTTMSSSPAAGPAQPQAELYRNATADEVLFIHHGHGTLHTMFGVLPFRPYDYVVIPRCTTYRLEFDAGTQPDLLVIEATGNVDIPPSTSTRTASFASAPPTTSATCTARASRSSSIGSRTRPC